MQEFIPLINSRSDEHKIAFSRIHDLPGSMMSTLRQEADSLIRLVLLHILMHRDHLIPSKPIT